MNCYLSLKTLYLMQKIYHMVSFDNTENAFKAKTNADLTKSYWLFKLVSNPAMVNFGAKVAPLSLNIGFKGIIKNTIFKQFVGGETIHDCSNTIVELGKYNIGTILDYSVEGKESEADFDACLNETLETIEKAKHEKHIPFCVFKVTGLARFALLEKVSANEALSDAEINEYNQVKFRVSKICKAAHDANQAIFIDAEESWIQQAIDDLADDNMSKHNLSKPIVYNTFQLYRHDRLDFLKASFKKAQEGNYFLGAKLVRGAYMEKERERAIEKKYSSPINKDKESSDKLYNDTILFCVEHIDKIAFCAGSHNEQSALYLAQLMTEKNLPKNHPHISFAQLYGMSDHISYNLSLEGYNIAKYVPYGPVKEVLPYLIRRAQENTSVKGQTGRELSLIIKEKARRKA